MSIIICPGLTNGRNIWLDMMLTGDQSKRSRKRRAEGEKAENVWQAWQGDKELAQAGSLVSGYTIISTVKTKHLLTSLNFGLKDTWVDWNVMEEGSSQMEFGGPKES